MKKFLNRLLLLLLLLSVIVAGYVLMYFPPVMAGMDAKTMCSCVFVAGRTEESVLQKELKVFPGLTMADITIDAADSSVTAHLFWQTSKAIYRKGLGCTLLSEQSEAEVRGQNIVRPSRPAIDQDTIRWPDGNRLPEERLPGVDYDSLQLAMNAAFQNVDPEKPVNTHAVVVVHNGVIIGEKYAPGFSYNSPMMGWSMTKSIANALVGILAADGKLSIDDPAPVQEWQSDDRRKITINNLLQASTGLHWGEGYFIPTSDFHRMFIRSDNKAAFAASRELEHEPGTVFNYSSGATNILSRIVRQYTGDNYHRFPYERLFDRIGMHTAILEPDASGTFVASSYGFASARDWARFGLLYLNDGVWNGERILPEGWVKYSTTPAPAAPLREYGAQIWLNAGKEGDPEMCYFPGLPNEAYLFEGFEQQAVVVIPSRKTVIVRLGVTHNKNFSLPALVNGVLASLPD